MTSETDAEFVERIKREWDGDNVPCVEDFDQLIALARRGAAVQDVVDAAMWAIDLVARYNSPERITEARALVRGAALPPPPAGETNE